MISTYKGRIQCDYSTHVYQSECNMFSGGIFLCLCLRFNWLPRLDYNVISELSELMWLAPP